MKLILASASPRRKELLGKIGMEFEIIPAKGEEVITQTLPWEVVKELSFQKAKEIADKQKEECIVIGSDTIVAKGEKIMGKPKDEEDAFMMLKALQGREHSVITGVTMIFTEPGKEDKRIIFSKETKVWFYSMNDDEIRAYIDTKEPMDKAGAYGIQGGAALFCPRMVGDYYKVMGLPVCRLGQMLKEIAPELMEETL